MLMKKASFTSRSIEVRRILSLCCALFCSLCLFAQSKEVTGKVTDMAGEPIIGANVLEKGTTNGVITDLDGNFSLTVSSSAVLQFSYIGYAPQEVSVAGKNIINVQMKEDAEVIDEVIVVGYGSQKKETLTGSVANIRGEEIAKSPAANVSSSLTGKLPGLIVN